MLSLRFLFQSKKYSEAKSFYYNFWETQNWLVSGHIQILHINHIEVRYSRIPANQAFLFSSLHLDILVLIISW